MRLESRVRFEVTVKNRAGIVFYRGTTTGDEHSHRAAQLSVATIYAEVFRARVHFTRGPHHVR